MDEGQEYKLAGGGVQTIIMGDVELPWSASHTPMLQLLLVMFLDGDSTRHFRIEAYSSGFDRALAFLCAV